MSKNIPVRITINEHISDSEVTDLLDRLEFLLAPYGIEAISPLDDNVVQSGETVQEKPSQELSKYFEYIADKMFDIEMAGGEVEAVTINRTDGIDEHDLVDLLGLDDYVDIAFESYSPNEESLAFITYEAVDGSVKELEVLKDKEERGI